MTAGLSGWVVSRCASTTCHQPAPAARTANATTSAIPVLSTLVPIGLAPPSPIGPPVEPVTGRSSG